MLAQIAAKARCFMLEAFLLEDSNYPSYPSSDSEYGLSGFKVAPHRESVFLAKFSSNRISIS